MNDKVCKVLVQIGACVMITSGILAANRIIFDISIVLFPASFGFCVMVCMIDKLWFEINEGIKEKVCDAVKENKYVISDKPKC